MFPRERREKRIFAGKSAHKYKLQSEKKAEKALFQSLRKKIKLKFKASRVKLMEGDPKKLLRKDIDILNDSIIVMVLTDRPTSRGKII